MWKIENGKLTNTDFVNVPEESMSKPYPASLWRIDPLVNDGMPYHLLLPNITAINVYTQPQKELIHVYDSRETVFTGNGYAVIQPISCEVRHEKNGMYEAELEAEIDEYKKFTYLSGNSILKIPIRYHDKVRQQLFRIYNYVPRMDSSGAYHIKVNARHIFYDLSNKILTDCHPNGENGNNALKQIFGNVYGSSLDSADYEFYSDISKLSNAQYKEISVTEALLGADDAFINRWGGSLYRDNYYFSINKDMENCRSTGVIRYGYNMIDIEFSADYSECVTHLIATDNFGNRTTISNSSVPCKEFPHHIYKAVSFSYDYDDMTQFLADAQAYYDNYKQVAVNIKVTFADLSDNDLYTDFLELSDYEVGDKVIVYHKDLDINYGNLEIISKTYDVVDRKTASIEIGTFKHAISRSGYMANTATSGSQTAAEKQVSAVKTDIGTAITMMLGNHKRLGNFTHAELSKYTYKKLGGK